MRIIYYTKDTDIIIKPDTDYNSLEYSEKDNLYVFRFPSCRIDLTPKEVKHLKTMLAGAIK